MLKLLFPLFAGCGLLLAGPAAAVSLWHADVYTSSLLGNAHVAITLPTSPSSIPALLGQTDLEHLGAGLGTGYVAKGSPITLTHTFATSGPRRWRSRSRTTWSTPARVASSWVCSAAAQRR
jgi:hypothetical protein